MIASFCGHRDALLEEKDIEKLDRILETLAEEGVNEFLLGEYGNFDRAAAAAVKKLKVAYPHIRSVLVIPYLDGNYDTAPYDTTVYPPLERAPKRFAITYRNRWMVERSDVIISYVRRDWGGAASTLSYAKSKKKRIIPLL